MKKPFTPSKSYTCVREFIIAYPNKEKPEFVLDKLPKYVGTRYGNRTRLTDVKGQCPNR